MNIGKWYIAEYLRYTICFFILYTSHPENVLKRPCLLGPEAELCASARRPEGMSDQPRADGLLYALLPHAAQDI
jgi:hypothetical protein